LKKNNFFLDCNVGYYIIYPINKGGIIMGFDLYGMNPYNPNKAIKPELDWDSQPTREETDKYFKEKSKYQQEVVGDYFRNNVWWWRPLASYVIKFTGCIDESDQVAKDKWDDIWNSRKWNASYPFSVENVKEFAEFCRFSGGFKIC
jgi:hypothetical protein